MSFAELGLLPYRVMYGTLRALMPLAPRTTTVLFAKFGLLRGRIVLGILRALKPLALRSHDDGRIVCDLLSKCVEMACEQRRAVALSV